MNAMQMDWVGEAPKKPKAQITIPDKRPLIAARKAELALQIGERIRRAPAAVSQGSVQAVRAWLVAVEAAKKAVGSRTSSVVELESALKALDFNGGAS